MINAVSTQVLSEVYLAQYCQWLQMSMPHPFPIANASDEFPQNEFPMNS